MNPPDFQTPCVVRTSQRPSSDVVKGLAQYGVATIHEAQKRRGLMAAIHPAVPGSTLCGPAVTSLNHAGDNLMLHAAIEQCQAGDVLVVATTAPSTHGMFGELLATLCQARGLAGVILDAGVRDVAQIREMGFPVWSRAVSAAGTSKANPGWVNVPVTCGGTIVRPGDIVIGDDDGVVVVPAESARGVLHNAELREQHEAAVRERFRRGELSLDTGNLRPLLESLGVRYWSAVDEVHPG